MENYMKKYTTAFIIAFATLFSLACSDTAAKKDTKTNESKVVMKTINVKGVTCEGCEGAIVDYVTKIDGVVSSKASHIKESVIVKYDEAKTDIDAISKVISSSGYKVDGVKEDIPNKK